MSIIEYNLNLGEKLYIFFFFYLALVLASAAAGAVEVFSIAAGAAVVGAVLRDGALNVL